MLSGHLVCSVVPLDDSHIKPRLDTLPFSVRGMMRIAQGMLIITMHPVIGSEVLYNISKRLLVKRLTRHSRDTI